MRYQVLIALILFLHTLSNAQGKKSNWGVDIYANTLGISGRGLGNSLYIGVSKVSKSGTLISGAIGTSLGDNINLQFIPKRQTFLNGNVLFLSLGKRKVSLTYGASIDIGIGNYLYAYDNPSVTFVGYYNRVFTSFTPQGGIVIKIGAKSKLFLLASAGIATTFLKVNQAPTGSYSYNRILIPIGIGIRYRGILK